MNLHQLPKTTTPKKKRLGRGYGSGKGGHTSSRGQKGQRSRSSIPVWFEGGQLPVIRRVPYQRGKGRFKSLKPNPLIVNLSQINNLKSTKPITIQTLIDNRLIDPKKVKKQGVKILGRGKLTHAVTVDIPCSQNAAQKIIAAGGKVTTQKDSPAPKQSAAQSTKAQ